MFRPRIMLLRSRRAGWTDGSILSTRCFSIYRTLFVDKPRVPSKTQSSAPAGERVRSPKPKIPPTKLNAPKAYADRPRPRRIVDARSFAAKKDGQSGPPARLKAPAHLSAQGRFQRGGRKSKTFGRPGAAKAQRRPRTRGPKNPSFRDIDDVQKAEVENVYRELAQKSEPIPTRYQPQPPDLHNLSETWPSLPTNSTATTAGVVEKLSLLSERIPNGYIPPHELGKRLSEGKYVRFLSEEEKTQALEAAKKFSQEDADKLSQQKGDLVDPAPVNFQKVAGEEHKSLIESLVQGKYPSVKNNKAPVVGDILRNLRNNETYQAAGKASQFMAKIESLLATNRPTKRA